VFNADSIAWAASLAVNRPSPTSRRRGAVHHRRYRAEWAKLGRIRRAFRSWAQPDVVVAETDGVRWRSGRRRVSALVENFTACGRQARRGPAQEHRSSEDFDGMSRTEQAMPGRLRRCATLSRARWSKARELLARGLAFGDLTLAESSPRPGSRAAVMPEAAAAPAT